MTIRSNPEAFRGNLWQSSVAIHSNPWQSGFYNNPFDPVWVRLDKFESDSNVSRFFLSIWEGLALISLKNRL